MWIHSLCPNILSSCFCLKTLSDSKPIAYWGNPFVSGTCWLRDWTLCHYITLSPSYYLLKTHESSLFCVQAFPHHYETSVIYLLILAFCSQIYDHSWVMESVSLTIPIVLVPICKCGSGNWTHTTPWGLTRSSRYLSCFWLRGFWIFPIGSLVVPKKEVRTCFPILPDS